MAYREALPIGTKIEFQLQTPSGRPIMNLETEKPRIAAVYEIVGKPSTAGGSSLVYPAKKEGDAISRYVIKECFPANGCYRADNSEIVPKDPADAERLRKIQMLVEKEAQITKRIADQIHSAAQDFASEVSIELPNGQKNRVHNTMYTMPAIEKKGISIKDDWEAKAGKRYTPEQALHITKELLVTLAKIHYAGYLFGDISLANIYLENTLDNMHIFMIDFGAARELKDVDGKLRTDPILRGEFIPTTDGFTPAKVSQFHNGEIEQLRLGPEDDLFSVGCLVLFLLTGQKLESKRLDAVHYESYVDSLLESANMNVDAGTMERLRDTILTALEGGYESAQAMFNAVAPLWEKVRTEPTHQAYMEHDAYIVCGGGIRDQIAALTLRRGIETNRLARKIKKEALTQDPRYAAGNRNEKEKARDRKRLGLNVFVARGELNAGDDRMAQHREALERSRNLVILCSKETKNLKENSWIYQQIKYFFEYNQRSFIPEEKRAAFAAYDRKTARKIILVSLEGGDPREMVPEQLKFMVESPAGDEALKDERSSYIANAASRSLLGMFWKLRGDPCLPEVLAKLLDKPQAEVVARAERWKRQRTTAAAALLGVFLLYACGNIIKIKFEHGRAEHGAALTLVQEAEKRLAENDTVEALELLVEALPNSEHPDRPVLPATELALERALSIYKTPGAVRNTASAVGRIETPYSSYFLDETGRYLFLWGPPRESLEVWDMESMTLLREIKPKTNISQQPGYQFLKSLFESEEMLGTGDDFIRDIMVEAVFGTKGVITSPEWLIPGTNRIIIQCYNLQLFCFDYVTGEMVWEWFGNQDAMTAALSADGKYVVTLFREYEENCGTVPEGENVQALEILSAETGEILKHIQFIPGDNQFVEPSFHNLTGFVTDAKATYVEGGDICVSEDLKWVAFTTQHNDTRFSILDENGKPGIDNSVYLLNLETGTCRQVFASTTDVDEMKFFGDQLVVMRSDISGFQYVEENAIISTGDPHVSWVEAYDAESLNLQWSRRDEYKTSRYVTVLKMGPTGIFVSWSDRLLLLDQTTGQEKFAVTLPDSVVDVMVTDDNHVEVILTDGTAIKLNLTSAVRTKKTYFAPGVAGAVRRGDNIYVQEDDFSTNTTIVKYAVDRYSQEYQRCLEIDDMGWKPYGCYDSPQGMRVLLEKDDRLKLVNLDTGEVIDRSRPEAVGAPLNGSIFGVSADGLRVYWADTIALRKDEGEAGTNYYRLDLISGEVTKLKSEWIIKQYGIKYLGQHYFDEKVFYFDVVSQKEDQLRISCWDLRSNSVKVLARVPLPPIPQMIESEMVEWMTESYPDFNLSWLLGYSYNNNAVVVDEENREICIAIRTPMTEFPEFLIKVDVDSGKYATIPIEFEPDSQNGDFSGWNGIGYRWNGKQAVFPFEGQLYVVKDEKHRFIVKPEADLAGLRFTPDGDGLLVIDQLGTMIRYSTEDGAVLSRISLAELSPNMQKLNSDKLKWAFMGDHDLMLYTKCGALRVDLSNDGLAVRSVIDNCFAYDKKKDRYLICEQFDGHTSIGTFPRYHIDQLADKARAVLGE